MKGNGVITDPNVAKSFVEDTQVRRCQYPLGMSIHEGKAAVDLDLCGKYERWLMFHWWCMGEPGFQQRAQPT